MLKKKVMILILAGLVATLSGCATYLPGGSIYTEGKTGVVANNGVTANKTGKACMKSYLGVVAIGDASISAAMSQGGIKNVSTIEYEVKNIIGFGTYCTVVTGN